MWFFNNSCSKVEATFLTEALPNGYQGLTLQLLVEKREIEVQGNTVTETPEQDNFVEVVLPLPWAVNKENGGLKITTDDTLTKLQNGEVEYKQINKDDVEIFKTVREVKKQENRKKDYPMIREIWEVYNEEDFGVMVFKVESGKRYQIDYTHKVSIFSTLFVPIRFSNYQSLSKAETNIKIWTVNCTKGGSSKFLEVENVDSSLLKVLRDEQTVLDCYTPKEDFDFGEDAVFGATNWDSSDDDFEGDDLSDSE